MNVPEKSDSPIVAVKPANEAARAVEEQVEPRGETKETVDPQSTARTQSREAVSHAQARIREAVARNRTQPLTGGDLEANLQDLHARVHRGGYRALASRRRYIPKADGRRRPLGIPTRRAYCTSRSLRWG